MNDCTIIVLGATGDLSRRKIIPALYKLIKQKKLTKFLIIGAAREDANPSDILEKAKKFVHNPNTEIWDSIRRNFFYQKLNFNHKKDFDVLSSVINDLETEKEMSGNRLIYCAVSSYYFCTITKHLAKAKIVRARTQSELPWERIVYEKPFGNDLGSAHRINKCISKCLYEHQIYRVDHYLTKELVSNISLVRFTNCIFEPLWNNKYIDHVQIILSEDICIEGRGLYYDKYGAVRDVMQNHMLELLALIAMEMPKLLTGEFIRYERTEVLKNVKPVDICKGQFEGYTQSLNVDPNSKTETFAIARLEVDNPRWSGVPFFLKTGKCLSKKQTIIHIKFKKSNCLLTEGCPLTSNYLTIEVAPSARFSLTLNVKKPGALYNVVPVDMAFCHDALLDERSAEAYEILFEEVMRGEQSVSVRFDEIEYAWKVVDELNRRKAPLYKYKPGSDGPEECKKFEDKHGMRWQS